MQYQWYNVARDLLEKYAAANDGRFPPLDTTRRTNFKLSTTGTSEALYNASIPVINDFRNWFNNEFFQYDDESCSNAMLVISQRDHRRADFSLVYDIGTGGLPVSRSLTPEVSFKS